MNTLNVLVVDDDEIIRETLIELITELSVHSVSGVASGEAAIDLFQSGDESFSAAFVDNKMNGISGIETISHLRKISPDTLFIFCSGEAVHFFPEGGQPDFQLLKPFDIQKLMSLLAEMANRNDPPSD